MKTMPFQSYFPERFDIADPHRDLMARMELGRRVQNMYRPEPIVKRPRVLPREVEDLCTTKPFPWEEEVTYTPTIVLGPALPSPKVGLDTPVLLCRPLINADDVPDRSPKVDILPYVSSLCRPLINTDEVRSLREYQKSMREHQRIMYENELRERKMRAKIAAEIEREMNFAKWGWLRNY